MAKAASRILITPVYRMSFPNLSQPRSFQDKADGKKSYNVEMIFEAADLQAFKLWNDETGNFEEVDVRQIAAQVAKEQWPGINVKSEFQPGRNWPIHDGDTRAAEQERKGKKGDHYKGMKVIRAGTDESIPPRLYTVENKRRVELVRGDDADKAKIESLFVGGNYALSEVTVKATETPQGRFIKFYLGGTKFVRQGEKLGSPSMMDRFDGITGGSSEHDPTDGLDDDIPF